MATFDFPLFTPDFMPSNSDFNLLFNTKLRMSTVNNSQSISDNPGEYWHVLYRFNVLYPEQVRALKGLLYKLRGHRNFVRCIDSSFSQTGSWPGVLKVSNGGQYGLTLDVYGAPSNTLIGYATDRIKVQDQLFELTANAVSDATGRCILQLANEIRQPLLRNANVITNPSGLTALCRWEDPAQIKQFAGKKRLYRNIKLSFIEKL